MKQWFSVFLMSTLVVLLTACGGGGGSDAGSGDGGSNGGGSNGGGSGTVDTNAPALKLKKTGQTVSYYAKDDGDYQKGITPSYTRDDAKEVVTDNVTGLMWQDDAATVTKPWVTQANFDAGNYSDTSGDTATTYCAELTLGGYSDWRLPSVGELGSIVDYGRASPVIDTVFINTASESYWSSTTQAGRAYDAWVSGFNSGDAYSQRKYIHYYVRCVR